MLSAGAAAWFGASRPRNFFEVGDTPVTKRFHVGRVPVAVILFRRCRREVRRKRRRPRRSSLRRCLPLPMPLPTPQSASGSARGDLRESSPSARRWNSVIIFCSAAAPARRSRARSTRRPRPHLVAGRQGRAQRHGYRHHGPARAGRALCVGMGLSMQAQEVRLTSAVPSDPHMEALVAGKAAR